MSFHRIYLTLLILAVSLAGCHYYKVGVVKSITSEYVEKKSDLQDYIILHANGSYWNLREISIEDDKIMGTISEVSPSRMIEIERRTENPVKKTFKYKRAGSISIPTNEVHLYVSDSLISNSGRIGIEISDIIKMEVYDEALGATVASYVLPTAAVLGATAAVIIAITCSCPYVYTFDGEQYTFQGGVFPGSIYPTLERNDYLVLKDFRPVDGAYHLRLSNEKMETEFINQVNLELISHDPGVSVIRDRHGTLHTYESPQPPIDVADPFSRHLDELSKTDGRSFQLESGLQANGLSEAIFTFARPQGSKTAQLILNGKNTRWFDYTFTEFVKLFGDYYPAFSQKQASKPAEEHIQWTRDQGVILNVYVHKKGEWVFQDYFNVAGSQAFKDMIMAIDISDIPEDHVSIKLEAGFRFWELDFLGLDFSETQPIESMLLSPDVALDASGRDHSELLAAADMRYSQDLEKGDEIKLSFEAPPSPGEGRSTTAILHARGYYLNRVFFPGKPRYSQLKKFRRQGHLSRFSFKNYQSLGHSVAAGSN